MCVNSVSIGLCFKSVIQIQLCCNFQLLAIQIYRYLGLLRCIISIIVVWIDDFEGVSAAETLSMLVGGGGGG